MRLSNASLMRLVDAPGTEARVQTMARELLLLRRLRVATAAWNEAQEWPWPDERNDARHALDALKAFDAEARLEVASP